MSDGASGSGWTSTIFVTAIAIVVMAVLAFALSGYRDPRVVQDAPVASGTVNSDEPGRGAAR